MFGIRLKKKTFFAIISNNGNELAMDLMVDAAFFHISIRCDLTAHRTFENSCLSYFWLSLFCAV